MNVDLQKTFPYSKDELNATMATVSIYVVSILKGALPQHRLELKKGYFQCLYPLYAIWEGYGDILKMSVLITLCFHIIMRLKQSHVKCWKLLYLEYK